jgi:hypothetical protein
MRNPFNPVCKEEPEMRKNLFVPILVSMLLLGCAQWVRAGVEPSPFCVGIVKLQNVFTSIEGNNRMLKLLLSYDRVRSQGPADICYPPDPGIVCHPPEPGVSPDACVITFNTLAEEIRGLAKDVQRLEEAVYDVTKHPPEPGVPFDAILRELGTIRESASDLIGLIDTIPPPDDQIPPPDDNKVQNALAKLKRNAQSMINTIDAFGPPPDDQIPPGGGF